MDDKGDADKACYDVCSWLGDLHTVKFQQRNANQQHGNGDEA